MRSIVPGNEQKAFPLLTATCQVTVIGQHDIGLLRGNSPSARPIPLEKLQIQIFGHPHAFNKPDIVLRQVRTNMAAAQPLEAL